MRIRSGAEWLRDWLQDLLRGRRAGVRPAALALAFGVAFAAQGAAASVVEFRLSSFTGHRARVNVVLDDLGSESGDIRMTVSVSGRAADLRGVFFNLVDEALLSGLSVLGEHVSGFETGSILHVGRGNNLRSERSPGPFDVGVGIGTPGIGRDDLRSTVLVLRHDRLALDLAMFSEQVFGVRLTSLERRKGREQLSREGSSKLGGQAPHIVPEPSSAALAALGVALLGGYARRRRRI